MAILTLFTFWRGWGHDIIVAQVMSTQLQNRQWKQTRVPSFKSYLWRKQKIMKPIWIYGWYRHLHYWLMLTIISTNITITLWHLIFCFSHLFFFKMPLCEKNHKRRQTLTNLKFWERSNEKSLGTTEVPERHWWLSTIRLPNHAHLVLNTWIIFILFAETKQNGNGQKILCFDC